MNELDKAFTLKKTALFATLELDQSLALAEKLEPIELKNGEPIFDAGQTASRMFVVVHGQVKIYTDLSGSFVGPLDTFGEEALLRQSVRAYSAVATQDTLLLAMSRPHLIAIIKENPSVALFLLEQYSHHITMRQRETT